MELEQAMKKHKEFILKFVPGNLYTVEYVSPYKLADILLYSLKNGKGSIINTRHTRIIVLYVREKEDKRGLVVFYKNRLVYLVDRSYFKIEECC